MFNTTTSLPSQRRKTKKGRALPKEFTIIDMSVDPDEPSSPSRFTCEVCHGTFRTEFMVDPAKVKRNWLDDPSRTVCKECAGSPTPKGKPTSKETK